MKLDVIFFKLKFRFLPLCCIMSYFLSNFASKRLAVSERIRQHIVTDREENQREEHVLLRKKVYTVAQTYFFCVFFFWDLLSH